MIERDERGPAGPEHPRPEAPGPGGPSRRDFIALGVGAMLVAAAPAALRRRPELVRRRVPVMGTVADVAVVHPDPRWAQGAVEAALDELRRVEALMTRFRDDSDVGRVNLAAAGEAVRVSGETARVLEASLQWARLTDGGFDPCLARAVELWNVESRTEPPAPDELRRWAGRDLWRSLEVEVDRDGARVVRSDPDAAVDLGGIAKGWGVDRAVRALRDRGITRGLVNVGGDLYALGVSEDGDPWTVGVQDPNDPERLVHTLRVSDRAVATSGDYQSYFTHGGRRYHHLLDPASGAPRRSPGHSVTVEADDCLTADGAATAVFGRSGADAWRLLAAGSGTARLVHGG